MKIKTRKMDDIERYGIFCEEILLIEIDCLDFMDLLEVYGVASQLLAIGLYDNEYHAVLDEYGTGLMWAIRDKARDRLRKMYEDRRAWIL